MALPDPCQDCRSDGGYWIRDWRREGVKRCSCPRGQALEAQDLFRKLPPVCEVEAKISEESAAAGVSMLSVMKYFPSEAGARLVIADELRCMCSDDSQIVWLAKRMAALFAEWPGMPALRSVFWSKFIPLDRKPAAGAAALFPDGVPPELPQQNPPAIGLLPGGDVSNDPQLDSAVKNLAHLKRLT